MISFPPSAEFTDTVVLKVVKQSRDSGNLLQPKLDPRAITIQKLNRFMYGDFRHFYAGFLSLKNEPLVGK
jgi:hypothetical protein